MTGPVAEVWVAMVAAATTLCLFAVVGRRTLAAIPLARGGSDAHRR